MYILGRRMLSYLLIDLPDILCRRNVAHIKHYSFNKHHARSLRHFYLKESPFYCFLSVCFPFIFKGEKGESGSPGKDGIPHQGAIKFSDTADTCTSGTAGTVRYSTSQNALQLCDGSAWLSVVTAGKGHVAYNPGRHCLDILDSGEFRMEQYIHI